MQRLIAAAVGAFFLTTLSAHAQLQPGKSCFYPAFRTAEGQTIDLEMAVRAGKPCKIRLSNSLAAISEARLLSKAAVGSVAVDGTSVIYTAKAGFSGLDKFTWAWVGQDKWGKDNTWPVQVLVTVVP